MEEEDDDDSFLDWFVVVVKTGVVVWAAGAIVEEDASFFFSSVDDDADEIESLDIMMNEYKGWTKKSKEIIRTTTIFITPVLLWLSKMCFLILWCRRLVDGCAKIGIFRVSCTVLYSTRSLLDESSLSDLRTLYYNLAIVRTP